MLILTADDIRTYIPVSVSATIIKVEPFIEIAENKYLKKIFGLDFLTKLNTYNTSSSQDDDNMNYVLNLAKRAECFLAYYEGFDLINTKINDSGFHRVEDQNDKSLFAYQERQLKSYFYETGLNTLEDLLEYLETHIDEVVFNDWADSDEYQEQKQYLINSAKEFTKVYKPLKNSRLVYLNLLSDLKQAEDFDIKPVLGDDLFEKLKELVLDGDIDDLENIAYKNLLPHVIAPLAYYTVARCIKSIGANFTESGLLFNTYSASGYLNKSESQDADKTLALINGATDTARKYKDILEAYMVQHRDDLPEYDEFIGDEDEAYDPSFDNTDKKIIRM
jgi:hypothetical protein